MQTNPDQLCEEVRRRQTEREMLARRNRNAHLFPSRPWLDVAMWSAVLGSMIGASFLVYFADVILSAVR
jgi:hypothetical protein